MKRLHLLQALFLLHQNHKNLIDDLRSQLTAEHRGRDNREIGINVQNSATQNQFLATMLNSLGCQADRATNSIVNVGLSIKRNSRIKLSSSK